jgi:hypothetical protein
MGEYILEPGNFWSNLAFIIIGLIILLKLKKILHHKIHSFNFIFLGFGSMAFHGTQTFIGQTLDVLGMYLLITALIFQLNSPRIPIRQWISANMLLLVSLIYLPEWRRWIFIFLVIGLIIMAIKKLKWSHQLSLSVALMITGQILWNIDRLKIICDPSSPINGHFFWHICSALSAFLFLLSSQPKLRTKN